MGKEMLISINFDLVDRPKCSSTSTVLFSVIKIDWYLSLTIKILEETFSKEWNSEVPLIREERAYESLHMDERGILLVAQWEVLVLKTMVK